MGINGAAGTNPKAMQGGALGNILKIISGSSSNAAKAQNFANQLYPDVPKADPWEAAFKYFVEMGKIASQPGATLLGSAVGAAQAPMDYLNAKKKEKTETELNLTAGQKVTAGDFIAKLEASVKVNNQTIKLSQEVNIKVEAAPEEKAKS